MNLGNTCYMNAALQVLLHCPALAGVLRNLDLSRFEQGVRGVRGGLRRRHELELARSFLELLDEVWSGKSEKCSAQKVLSRVRVIDESLRGCRQHDAHEFARTLLDAMHEALSLDTPLWPPAEPVPPDLLLLLAGPAPAPRPPALSSRAFQPLSELLEGRLRSEIKCSVCGTVSGVEEPFFDLSLEIPSEPELIRRVRAERGAAAAPRQANPRSVLSLIAGYVGLPARPRALATLLHTFCTSTALREPNAYHCRECKRRVEATKSLSVLRLPEVLCIHIKRFAFGGLGGGSKVSQHIQFPLRALDMRPFLHPHSPLARHHRGPVRYDLCGVVCHSGGRLAGGHYVAYARNHASDRWHCFDDSTVRPATETEVAEQEAYLLVYSLTRGQWGPHPGATACLASKRRAENAEGSRVQYCVSHYWRARRRYTARPGPVDNRILCCPHGVPLGTAMLKRLAVQVPADEWQALQAVYGGGPAVRLGLETPRCPSCEHAEACEAKRGEMRTVMSLELKSQAPLTKADPVWYLISEAWIRSWREYVRGRKRRRRPGPIDNSFLLHSDGRPLDRLSPVRDYRGLQRDVWEKLHAMYGGGPAIVRRRIDIYGPALEEPGTSPTRNSAGEGQQ